MIEYACSADVACTWNGTSCETAAVGCSSYTSGTSCEMDSSCNWSNYDGTCYTDYPSCSVYASQQYPCEADVDCMWTGSVCMDASVSCSSHTDISTCENDANCNWSVSANMCYDDLATCVGYSIEYACIADSACTWTGTSCADVGASCSGYVDQVNCDNDANCNWSYGTSMCYDDLGVCVNYTIQDPCQADIDCTWTGTLCVTTNACTAYAESGCTTMHTCWWDMINTYCEMCPVSTPYPLGCMCSVGTDCASGICGPSNFCVDTVACSSYTDQPTCDADMNCNWGSAMSTCYNNLGACTNYTEQYSCIADMEKSCGWDSGNVLCVETCVSDSACVTGYACALNASPATCVPCSTFDGLQTVCEGHTSKCTWNSGMNTCDSL